MAAHFQVQTLIAFACACTLAYAADPDDKPEKSSTKEPPVAKSHDELGRLVSDAIDNEDFATLTQLMAPIAMLKEIGAPEKSVAAYTGYVNEIPQLARQYRTYLQKEALLPLKGKPIRKHVSDERDRRQVHGKTIETSTGIRLLNEDDEIILELVDQAVAIDGRWYIARLCTESVEEQIRTKADTNSSNSGADTKKPGQQGGAPEPRAARALKSTSFAAAR